MNANENETIKDTLVCNIHPGYKGLHKPTSTKAGCVCKKIYKEKQKSKEMVVPTGSKKIISSKSMYKIPFENPKTHQEEYREFVIDKYRIVNFEKKYKKDLKKVKHGNFNDIGYSQPAIQYDYIEWIKKEHPEILKEAEKIIK